MEYEVSELTLPVGIIKPRGRMDAFSLAENDILLEQQRMISRGTKRLIIDLSKITFLDSMALSVLVSLMRRMEKVGGRMVIIEPESEAVRQSLYLARFDQVFELQKSVVEALAIL